MLFSLICAFDEYARKRKLTWKVIAAVEICNDCYYKFNNRHLLLSHEKRDNLINKTLQIQKKL